jgi:hypothetical protein
LKDEHRAIPAEIPLARAAAFEDQLSDIGKEEGFLFGVVVGAGRQGAGRQESDKEKLE